MDRGFVVRVSTYPNARSWQQREVLFIGVGGGVSKVYWGGGCKALSNGEIGYCIKGC